MFIKKSSNQTSEKANQAEHKYSIKYEKPKIMLIDMPPLAYGKLKSKGYNVVKGTFGSPYKVEKSDGYLPIQSKAILPNYTEQEIVFIDLELTNILEGPEGEKPLSKRDFSYWAKADSGIIDPRPSAMKKTRQIFNRIFYHGGVFIIYAKPREKDNIVWAQVGFNNELKIDYNTKIDNWSFLNLFSRGNFNINYDFGKEINIVDIDIPITPFLKKHIKGASFYATFEPDYRIKDNWFPLLKNKYGQDVGGLYFDKDSKGYALVLPQVSSEAKGKEIETILNEVIAVISPHLFPHIEGQKWIEREEYEWESIIVLKQKKKELQEKNRLELENIDKTIEQERKKIEFLNNIITKYDNELVDSLESCLKYIGFKDVINVDRIIKESEQKTGLQEDLQIKDKSPIILIEAKGISGLPTEADTIQINKYVTRRMKDWDRRDVQGVSIINHQRNIPALERNNKNVFTNQQINDAESLEITLITTWELYQLIIGMQKWGWNPSVVQDVFYEKGRFNGIPSNYKIIGEVNKYWDNINIVGINITQNEIKKGDRIGYLIPTGYMEEIVESLQINNEDIDKAVAGQSIGSKTRYGKEILKKGIIVCKVMQSNY